MSNGAALTGHAEAIAETARLTDYKIELDEYTKEEINRKLRRIAENIADLPTVKVCYFVPDEKKAGGSYVDYKGRVRRIDEALGRMIFEDGKDISIDDIINLREEVSDKN